MKQLLQRLDTGDMSLTDVPVPLPGSREILVETRATVISAGTERMLLDFGRASLLQKARGQPDRVRQVLDKVRSDGIAATIDALRAKLDTPFALGYCNAGVIVSKGGDCDGFGVGDAVVTNGPHAEYVRVSRTLAARIPTGIPVEAAAFTPLAAIGLQGIRLASPTLGESVVVLGLGLIGLLTVQMLRANGCRVIGIDPDASRRAMAQRFGALPLDAADPELVRRVMSLTNDVGADAVLLTLSSDSNDPVQQAACMSRRRGRLVLVGVTGLALSRDELYRKELSLTVSCSYGPGRYDRAYERAGVDYPLPYVRWTEQRNFEAVLELMRDGRLDPLPLVSHRYDLKDARNAYTLLANREPSLGIVLRYPDHNGVMLTDDARVVVRQTGTTARRPQRVIGVIGAGNFATRTLLPELRRHAIRFRAIASSAGVGAAIAGEKFRFERITTAPENVIDDDEIDTVFILTRHDSHASLTVRALEAGKHVFVEKPLALREEDLVQLERAAAASTGLLTVGFNRRFAPMAQQTFARMSDRAGPVSMVMTVNAGHVPPEHWVHDIHAGGGRIVGEGCHFIDLARYMARSEIEDLQVASARDAKGQAIEDNAHISVRFAGGSTASIHYLSSGARAYPKERIECFFDGHVIVIENWRRLRHFGGRRLVTPWRLRADKGHRQEIAAWLAAVRDGGPAPIPYEELFEVARWSIRAGDLARGARSSSGTDRMMAAPTDEKVSGGDTPEQEQASFE